jgi:catechol 2,3-dioxygenase-like lactoylglutathione lyase family enzyme
MIDRIEKMLAMYESGAIDRRQFLNGLLIASVAPPVLALQSKATFHGRVINHVTLSVTDVNRSREFYQRLLGATIINPQTTSKEPARSFDLRIGDSFIGLYPLGQPVRIDHFCVGVDNFDADRVMAQLQQQYPASKPSISPQSGPGEKEVYLTDPDGIRLQLSDVKLKL